MVKPNGRGFHYRERTREDLKERANMRGGNFDDYIKPKYKKYKVRDGKNLIRILPPTWENARHYGLDIWLNYSIGPDNNTYLSLSKMGKGRDPIAEAQREASREGDEKLAKDLSPKQRILMWVIDRQAEDEGPQLWAAPFSVDKDFATLSFDPDTNEVIFIDDPDKGCDVRFFKEGTGLTTKYPAAQMKILKPKPLHEDEKLMDEWLAFVQDNPVPECLNYYDADYIAEVFSGQPKAKPQEQDKEDEEPARPRLRAVETAPPPRRARSVVEDDGEDEDESVPTKSMPPAGGSIRERIQARRAQATSEDED